MSEKGSGGEEKSEDDSNHIIDDVACLPAKSGLKCSRPGEPLRCHLLPSWTPSGLEHHRARTAIRFLPTFNRNGLQPRKVSKET